MNISSYIARRYLFSKKSRNVINIISGISMVVVAGITAAMVIVLSAFNGIDDLVKELFSSFTPDLIVLPVEGRTFEANPQLKDDLLELSGIEFISEVIEEDVWIRNGEYNTVATLKGVQENYSKITTIDSMMVLGYFRLYDGEIPVAIAGYGVFSELGAHFRNGEHDLITLNAPIRGKKLRKSREKAFNSKAIGLGGVYSINAELDVKYIITSLSFCRDLFGFENEISSLEIKVNPEFDLSELQQAVKAILPAGLQVRSRYQQNALVFQTTESEKWAVSLILLFILVIAAFNIVASLTMLIIEKKQDIFILSSFGTRASSINQIFAYEGIMIYLIGALSGLALGVLLCVLQQEYGWVELQGAMVDYYPVEIRGWDLVGIAVAVMTVGILFSAVLVKYLVKRFALNVK